MNKQRYQILVSQRENMMLTLRIVLDQARSWLSISGGGGITEKFSKGELFILSNWQKYILLDIEEY